MLNLPITTEVNKNIPKSKFYDKADITPALKKCFTDDIEKITWTNKLSPTTLNISEGKSISEIEVFLIKLKAKTFSPKILEAIDKAIPYYILFTIEYNNNYQLWLGYKEKTGDSKHKAKIIRYFTGKWCKTPILALQGDKLDTIYENFLSQLSDNQINTNSEASVKEQVATSIEIQKLEPEIAKLTKKCQAEKQFDRQVKLHNKIKELNLKLQELKNG